MKIYNKFPENEDVINSIFLHFTGSMFGIGCSAYNIDVINKINLCKERENKSRYIVLIPKVAWLRKFNVELNTGISNLLQQYWPGELTVILEISNIKLNYVSHKNKVAFRIPTNKFLREFIEKMDHPIISTSVNISGNEPMTNLDEIQTEYDNWFDFGVLSESKMLVSKVPSSIIEASDNRINLIREGSIPFSEIERSFKQPQILLVCTGNTCRSPMVEYFLQKLIDSEKLNYQVSSAGLLEGGQPISENSKKILKLNGIDASKHISQQITHEVIRSSRLILTMTMKHKNKILQLYPNSIYKVFTISEFAGFKGDIEDPIGKGEKYYDKTFTQIKERIQIIFDRIKGER